MAAGARTTKRSYVCAQMQTLMHEWREFFNLPMAVKNPFRTTSLKGTYMTPEPGLHEVFEYKTVNRDPLFRCPPQCAATTAAVFAWCEQLARAALRVMLERVSTANKSAWLWRDAEVCILVLVFFECTIHEGGERSLSRTRRCACCTMTL